jgi:phytoene dehydrogenase-like protein
LKIELNDPKPGKGIQAERPLQFPAKKQLSTRRFMLPTLDLRRLKMGGKKVIIIGAGIAGLSLGCYLQKSGFLTEIYEANGRAGGLCSGWERDGYRIDGGLKALWGSGLRHPFYKLYSELVDMDALAFSYPKIKSIYEFPDGKKFVEYADLVRLEKAMMATAGEDEAVIREWTLDVRKISELRLPLEKPKELYGISDRMRAGKGAAAALHKKWGSLSAEDFAKKFKNPFLSRWAACFRTPVLADMIDLAAMDSKANGYPAGGADAFARKLEEAYGSLGGRVHTMSRAQKIHVENRKAWGVRFADGRDVRGDIIVSAMDGRSTLFDLLGGKFTNTDIRAFYEKPDLGPSMLQVSIGVDKAFEDDFSARKIVLDASYELHDGSVHPTIEVMRFSQTAGGKRKALFRVQLDTKFASYWWLLRKAERERYRKEKGEVAAWAAGVIDERVCPIAKDIEMTDVSTPATYIRMTGNWRGAITGWGSGSLLAENPFDRELPGLENFYMAGHWVQPGGGIPLAYKSARDLAQVICRDEKMEFKPV